MGNTLEHIPYTVLFVSKTTARLILDHKSVTAAQATPGWLWVDF